MKASFAVRFAIASLMTSLLCSQSLQAQSTWGTAGGITGNWSAAGNWSPSVVPVSSTTTQVIFGNSASGTAYTSTNDISPGSTIFNLNSITINHTESLTHTLVSGRPFSLVGTSPQIMMNGVGASQGVANFTITRETGSTVRLFQVDNTMTIGGSGNGTLTIVTDPLNALGETFRGTADVTVNFTGSVGTAAAPNLKMGNMAQGTGWSGNFIAQRGYTTAFFTTGDLFSTTTILEVQSGATFDFNANDEIMGGIRGAGKIITPTGGAIDVRTNTDLVWSGEMTGSGNFAKRGTGILTFDRSNGQTYSGNTTVAAGTLLVNNTSGSGTGTGSVSVVGGTLGGTGFIAGAVTLSGTTASTLNPGDPNINSGIGTLTLNNGLAVSGSSHIYRVNISGPIAGTDHDQLVVTSGNVSLGTTSISLDLSGASGSFTLSTPIVILNNTGSGTTTGQFVGLANGSVVTGLPLTSGITQWTIQYDYDTATGLYGSGNDIALIPVPEPTHVLMAAAAFLFVLFKFIPKL